MSELVTLAQIDETCTALRARIEQKPEIGLILGSGLGGFADQVEYAAVVPYQELPNWPISTVPGHQGRLVSGKLEGKPVVVMQGRVHYYEGYSMAQITLPVRVMTRLGARILIITNAAGEVNPAFNPGEGMG